MLRTLRATVIVEYDDTVDAAYILLDPDGPRGNASKGGSMVDGNDKMLMIFMNVSNVTGKIVGLEVLGASKKLPANMLPRTE